MADRWFVAGLLLTASGTCFGDARVDYLLHCSGCHLPDGSSWPPEVPTLVEEPGKLVGLRGGREYLVRVPGASQAPLSDDELADVINWMLREFSAGSLPDGFEPFTGSEVAGYRREVLLHPAAFRDRMTAGDE